MALLRLMNVKRSQPTAHGSDSILVESALGVGTSFSNALYAHPAGSSDHDGHQVPCT